MSIAIPTVQPATNTAFQLAEKYRRRSADRLSRQSATRNPNKTIGDEKPLFALRLRMACSPWSDWRWL
jgi:hypothetical protein